LIIEIFNVPSCHLQNFNSQADKASCCDGIAWNCSLTSVFQSYKIICTFLPPATAKAQVLLFDVDFNVDACCSWNLSLLSIQTLNWLIDWIPNDIITLADNHMWSNLNSITPCSNHNAINWRLVNAEMTTHLMAANLQFFIWGEWSIISEGWLQFHKTVYNHLLVAPTLDYGKLSPFQHFLVFCLVFM
jgi:hypothetical protein